MFDRRSAQKCCSVYAWITRDDTVCTHSTYSVRENTKISTSQVCCEYWGNPKAVTVQFSGKLLFQWDCLNMNGLAFDMWCALRFGSSVFLLFFFEFLIQCVFLRNGNSHLKMEIFRVLKIRMNIFIFNTFDFHGNFNSNFFCLVFINIIDGADRHRIVCAF